MTLTPPLQLAWRKDTQFVMAVAGNDSLYGITPSGKIQALRASDGAMRWESQGTYLTHRLVLQGNRLFAFREGDGLAFVDDKGASVAEKVVLSFAASATVNIGSPIVDDRMVYVAIGQGLYATHQEQGLKFGAVLSDAVPHSIGFVGSRDFIVVDGKGVPTRYRVGNTNFEVTWTGSPHGLDAGQMERAFVITGNHLVIGVGSTTVAYDISTGNIAWQLPNVPARAFVASNSVIYAGFHGASLWAIQAQNGAILWQRQYLYDLSMLKEYGLALSGTFLYYGGTLQGNPDGAVLMATNESDGGFTWLSRAVARPWAGGIPLWDGSHLFSYGSLHTGAYSNLSTSPKVESDQIEVNPRTLRGRASEFGSGTIKVFLTSTATISIAPYRERQGLGNPIVTDTVWSKGEHEVSWSMGSSGGFSDVNQFGYLLVEVAETDGPSYTQSLLMPVNSFPDITYHWAGLPIETMLYHKFVNGYPDQTFRPNGIVTRAESSTIIAKTLNLEGPSPAFKTKFTDIDGHWARNYVMALEEKGIMTGFLEPDGTYTFRPNLAMTRAQEARILVRAYQIPAAPDSFVTKFVDIAGHWATQDIKALEAAEYVNGFQESDGRYTYRPEQNLTRAELCTVVVRIRKLTRS